jgi:hypothetical protein
LPDAIAMIAVCGGNAIVVSGAAGWPPRLRAHRRELHLDTVHALERLDGCRHVARDPILERTALDGQQDVDADHAAVHLDGSQHPDLVDRTADLGIPDALQGLPDLRLRGHGLSSHRVTVPGHRVTGSGSVPCFVSWGLVRV